MKQPTVHDPQNGAARPRAGDDRPRVALVVETSLAPGREILMGLARYVR